MQYKVNDLLTYLLSLSEYEREGYIRIESLEITHYFHADGGRESFNDRVDFGSHLVESMKRLS